MQNSNFAVLVLPGLLAPPLEGRENLQAIALSTLLARATVHSSGEISFEAVLGKIFDCVDAASGLVPVAALEWPAELGVLPADGCLRADPVHLQLDRDHARLLEGEALDLSLGEAQALVDSINAHFTDNDMIFEVAESQHWYLSCKRKLDVDMSPPGYAAGRNVQHFLPGGDSGRYWNAFLTEVQMLLHTHPVNQHRQAHGQLPVNSLWLWGGGRPADIDGRRGGQVVYADGSLPAAMARRLGHELRALPEPVQRVSFDKAFILVDDRLLSPATYGRSEQWRSALDHVQSAYIEPALDALERGRLAGIILYPCNGHSLEIHRSGLWKFWLKRTPLDEYFKLVETST